MAIPAQTQYNTYNPDGVVTTFAYTFCAFDDADIKVYADDVLVSDSTYSVSGIGTRSGGNVVFTTAPVAGIAVLMIKLVPSFARSTDYQQSGELLSDTLDDDADRLYSIMQYNQSVAGRSLTFDDVTATAMVLIGNAAARMGKLLGFDASTGLPGLFVPADFTATTPTAYINTLLNDADSATARATLEIVKNAREQEGIRYTTAGTAPDFTITTASPAVSAYVEGQRFTIELNADGTIGSNTLNVNALGAKSLKQYDDAGNKRSGVCKSAQIAVVEYDGTDFVILNPLPVYPLSMVRQTVQGGPITAAGYPDFLPATDADLSLVTQNISASAPFVVCASQGFGLGSDRIGVSTANLTFTCQNGTNYLYVDVSSAGVITTGTTLTAPVYSPSLATGTNTFNYTTMTMYSSGTTKAWRVFVGEAIAAAGAVTSTIAYAYNGVYESANYGLAVSSSYTVNHNVGCPSIKTTTMVCTTTDGTYAVGYEFLAPSMDPQGFLFGHTGVSISVNTFISLVSANAVYVVDYSLPNTIKQITYANWKLKTTVKRSF